MLYLVDAVRLEYGWTIDYEDPPYVAEDMVDDTDPQWRAAHPNSPGGTKVNGSTFESSVVERDSALLQSPQGKAKALQSIVNDYSIGHEPGVFLVNRDGSGRLGIVGVSSRSVSQSLETIPALLDTHISLPFATRTGPDALDQILLALSKKAKTKVISFEVPDYVLPGITNIGGEDVPARKLLTSLLDMTTANLYWNLLYDFDGRMWMLNLYATRKSYTDKDGHKVEVFRGK